MELALGSRLASSRPKNIARRQRLGRYLGLGGSLVVAAASFAAGARQTGQPGPLDWERLAADSRYAFGCAAWLIGAGVLLTAWWLSRGAGGVRWTLTTAALWTVPLLLTAPIGSRDVYAYANQGDLYANGVNPYHSGPAALPTQWLNQMDDFWFTAPAPYGPLFIMLSAAIAVASSGNLTLAVIALRLTALAGTLVCVYFVPKLARHCGVPPASALWLGLTCPLTLIHLVGGAHNEALMLAGVLAALYFAVRGRLPWCAVVLGLAVSVKATALVAAPFAVLLLVPAGAWKAVFAKGIRLAAGMLAVFGAVTLVSGLGLGWVSALGVSGKSISWLSVPTGVGIAAAKAMFQL
ncbi:MAG: polyprenol phosphomannose-dependent alpha 1,6 mannosyltransferase MptB, partial [Stackebrandtia sp.]